jgi:WD40 repeat protein
MAVLRSGQNLSAKPNAFSPDGKYLVYSDESRIWLMNAGGGGETEIAPVAAGAWRNWAAGWTPDGGRVLSTSNRSGSPALYSLLMADGKPQGSPALLDDVRLGLVTGVGRAGVQVTRDGSLFYAVGASQTDAYFACLDPASLKLTAAPQRLNQRYIGDVLGLSNWAPDGGSLLYQAQGTVVLHSTGASGEREIRSSGASLRGLRFFPDGQSVLGVSTEFENGVRRDYLRRINLQTGLVSAFDAQMPSGAWSPTWDLSPDFKFLYYSAPSEPLPAPAEGGRIPDAGGPKTVRLIRRNLLSGEEIELLRLTCNANYLANYLTDVSVSPEGNQVSFNYRDTQNPSRTWLAVAPTSGGPARQVTENRGLGETRGRTRDGKHLLFVRAGVIYTISTEGGAEQPIGGMDLMGALSDLTVNPVSGLLTFTATQTRVDLMSYKNVFPPASPR